MRREAAAASLAAQPPGGDDQPVQFETLTITAQPDPLDVPLLRLRALLDASAPCLGCDARTPPTAENRVMGLIRFLLLPPVPPPRGESARVLAAVRCGQAGPEMDYRCP